MSYRAVPNDPALTTPERSPGTPAGVTVQWPIAREGLFEAWDIATGGGALVGVIDSGIDAAHPDLAARIAATVDQETTRDTGPATHDAVGHGTHVASLACAQTNNAVGIAGTGRDCRLIIEKSDLTDASIAASIIDATDRGAHAINMSFGDDGSRGTTPAITTALTYAFQRNVILVAAAADAVVEEQGQPANIVQPTGTGADPNAGTGLVVTAANYAGGPSGAGVGTQISLAAYGSFGEFRSSSGPRGLLAAFPANTTEIEQGTLIPPTPGCECRATFGGDSRYAYLQGTSMAAPQVAGIAAMARRLNPDASAPEILRLFKTGATRPTGASWNGTLGWGIVNAQTLLDGVRRIDRRAPASRLTGPRTTRARRVTLRWTGRDAAPAGLIASGVRKYELWRTIDGLPARRYATTVKRSRSVYLQAGRRYGFFTVAVDRAGNREARPRSVDLRVRRLRR